MLFVDASQVQTGGTPPHFLTLPFSLKPDAHSSHFFGTLGLHRQQSRTKQGACVTAAVVEEDGVLEAVGAAGVVDCAKVLASTVANVVMTTRTPARWNMFTAWQCPLLGINNAGNGAGKRPPWA